MLEIVTSLSQLFYARQTLKIWRENRRTFLIQHFVPTTETACTALPSFQDKYFSAQLRDDCLSEPLSSTITFKTAYSWIGPVNDVSFATCIFSFCLVAKLTAAFMSEKFEGGDEKKGGGIFRESFALGQKEIS